MQELELMVAKQCAKILQGFYPEIGEKWPGVEHMPEFNHPSFYMQTRPALGLGENEIKLLKYQVLSFPGFDRIIPVVYAIVMPELFNVNAIKNLSALEQQQKVNDLKIDRMYLVDTNTIANLWDRKAAASENEFIQECIVKESELRKVIEGGKISVKNKRYSIRDYYNVSARKYDFSIPVTNERTEISIGYILPKKDEYMSILEFFKK